MALATSIGMTTFDPNIQGPQDENLRPQQSNNEKSVVGSIGDTILKRQEIASLTAQRRELTDKGVVRKTLSRFMGRDRMKLIGIDTRIKMLSDDIRLAARSVDAGEMEKRLDVLEHKFTVELKPNIQQKLDQTVALEKAIEFLKRDFEIEAIFEIAEHILKQLPEIASKNLPFAYYAEVEDAIDDEALMMFEADYAYAMIQSLEELPREYPELFMKPV